MNHNDKIITNKTKFSFIVEINSDDEIKEEN